MTITRVYTGRSHTGYTITNDAGATARVYASKRHGYFVRTDTCLALIGSLLAARDLALSLVGSPA